MAQQIARVVGPPGCGKTTTLVDLAAEMIERYGADRVGYYAYTRAASGEAVSRLAAQVGCSPDRRDLPHVRTIHAECLAAVGGNVIKPPQLEEFGNAYGYDLQSAGVGDDGELYPEEAGCDGVYLSFYEWVRHKGLRQNVDQALLTFSYADEIDVRVAVQFIVDYEEFKHEQKVQDFTDMLTRALDSGYQPNLAALLVDEAQDLTPLQWALIDRWIDGCEEVLYAGDDDQAIYVWNGAEPRLFQDRKVDYSLDLEQSYRVPIAVHALAQTIAARLQRRIPKTYHPRPTAGEVQYTDDVLRAFEWSRRENGHDRTALVLTRNRCFMGALAGQLHEAGEPYVLGRRKGYVAGPLAREAACRVFGLALDFRAGKPFTVSELRALIDDDRGVPMQLGAGKDVIRLWTRGLRTQLERRVKDGEGDVIIGTIRRATDVGLTEAFVQRLDANPALVLPKIKAEDVDYYDRLTRKYGREVLVRWREHRCPVVVNTIHGAKGKEADDVVICSDLTKKPFDALLNGDDGEHRVAYVAVTRAKERLFVLDPMGDRAYDY